MCDAFGGAEEAAVDGGAGDAGGGPRSLVNGSFEGSDDLTCAGLFPFRAEAKPDIIAATGKKACRICTTSEAAVGSPGGAYAVYEPAAAVSAGRYRARVSARRSPVQPTPEFAFKLYAYRGAGVVAEQPMLPTLIVASEQYEQHVRQLELGPSPRIQSDRLELLVAVSPRPGECLLVDDFIFTRE